MRAKTYSPEAGKGGGRQAIWDLLRKKGSVSTGELITASGSTYGAVTSYMAQLAAHDYVSSGEAGMFTLENNTGPRAPSANAAERTVYDWNLNPPMKPAELKKIWKKSGLSLNAFGLAIGMSVNQGTRIAQMIDGSRVISPTVEAAALAFKPPKA